MIIIRNFTIKSNKARLELRTGDIVDIDNGDIRIDRGYLKIFASAYYFTPPGAGRYAQAADLLKWIEKKNVSIWKTRSGKILLFTIALLGFAAVIFSLIIVYSLVQGG